ncbi:MAG: DUF2809 domain-containing protein [Bacteroidia bacterium]|nr:DUF2809 domain-containing protein [Bacteroidia bacterium]NND25319.1 DUF2809 domain-containing protein [Flavobacteriaceae bacterium]MBT8279619.1 DUF2809 domain-containing protein [Bacteroidia bacterium]NNK59281.1 DUF2809 domain-containing protein [Flavobacteriaceae bacterium]NNL32265.1 DUF2809 domain-containing protein [Flavobacteriaceae bacterium]
MLKFNRVYFLLFLTLFVIEACIAIFLKDGFIRHTFGDFLVVILIYCFIRSFIVIHPITLAIIVLCLAFCVEYSQYFNLLERLGWENNTIAKLVLGSTYHMGDLLAYVFGIALVIIVETKLAKQSQ